MKKILLMLGLAALAGSACGQGSLTPPDAPGPTMKSLEEMQPRTLIVSLPATLANPGSYFIETNLVCTSDNTDGITITANNVTIDLCGFTISRTGSGTGYGILQSTSIGTLTVRNGTVKGWTTGIRALGQRNQFQNIVVENNVAGLWTGSSAVLSGCGAFGNVGDTAGYGLYAGDGSTITRCTASSNRATGGSASCYGIRGGAGAVITECVALGNRPSAGLSCGIYAGAGSTIRRCASTENDSGIDAEGGSSISDCFATRNYTVGVTASEACNVSGSLIALNGTIGLNGSSGCLVDRCLVSSNGSQGIMVGIGSSVKDCDVADNGLTGIDAGSDCHLLRNHCVGNNGSAIYVNGQGTRIENNLCTLNVYGIRLNQDNNLVLGNVARANSAGDYSLGSFNNYGAILTNPGMGFVSSNAWANFQF